MKKQLLSFVLLLATLVFFLACTSVLASIVVFILYPDVFSGFYVGISVAVVAIYALLFKLMPNFRKNVFYFLDNYGLF